MVVCLDFFINLLYGFLYFKGNDSQVIVTLTNKLTIIEELDCLLVPPSLKNTYIVGKPLKMYNDIYLFM